VLHENLQGKIPEYLRGLYFVLATKVYQLPASPARFVKNSNLLSRRASLINTSIFETRVKVLHRKGMLP